jgi:short-subunit dehydrogenase
MKQGTALVTGASSGIGAEFARRLASRGTGLVLVARDAARLEALAGELRQSVPVEVLPADLREDAGLTAVEDRLSAARDPVDLLVSNAGYATFGRFRNLDLAGELGMIDLHARGTVRLAHAAVRAMAARGGGGVITVASVAAFPPGPGLATYAATKAFILSLSESLHHEARADGVVVTCLCPGFTRTELQERAGKELRIPGPLWQSTGQVVDAALTGHARGRVLVIPGVLNKLMAYSTRITPRRLGAAVATALYQPRR